MRLRTHHCCPPRARPHRYVSCVLGCPYDGYVPPDAVGFVALTLREMGCYEISLGDTIGVGTPSEPPQPQPQPARARVDWQPPRGGRAHVHLSCAFTRAASCVHRDAARRGAAHAARGRRRAPAQHVSVCMCMCVCACTRVMVVVVDVDEEVSFCSCLCLSPLPRLGHLAVAAIQTSPRHVTARRSYGMALPNIVAALEEGVAVVDSSVGGLGGCPYAKGASGNVPTEDVVYLLHGMGIHTGVDLDALIRVGKCARARAAAAARAARVVLLLRAGA